MKLNPSVLKRIALSAGLAATISTATSDESKQPAKEAPVAQPADTEVVSASAQAIFLRHDTNKDGKLSLEEFNKAYAGMHSDQQPARDIQKNTPLSGPKKVSPSESCPACGMG